MTVGLLSFVGMIVFIFMSLRSRNKKDGKLKKNLLIATSCFVLMAICASLDDTPIENQAVEKKEAKEAVTSSKKEAEIEKDKQETLDNEDKAKVTASSEVEDKKKEEEKLKVEEEKKKEELAKQEELARQEAEKVKAEEDKKKEAEKVANKVSQEEQVNKAFQLIIEISEGNVIAIRQSPYSGLEWQQMQVLVSDAWYNTPEHEKERFAESVGTAVKVAIYESGIIKTDKSILVDFVDQYDKELATEKLFGGYEIKR